MKKTSIVQNMIYTRCTIPNKNIVLSIQNSFIKLTFAKKQPTF